MSPPARGREHQDDLDDGDRRSQVTPASAGTAGRRLVGNPTRQLSRGQPLLRWLAVLLALAVTLATGVAAVLAATCGSSAAASVTQPTRPAYSDRW